MSRTRSALSVLALASVMLTQVVWGQGHGFRADLYPADMSPLAGYELRFLRGENIFARIPLKVRD